MRRVLSIWAAILPVLTLCGGLCPAWAQEPGDASAVAAALFAQLDLSRPDLQAVAEHVRAGETDRAMALWRDLVVERLRRRDFGEYGWHGYKGHPRPVTLARHFAGTATEEAVERWHPDLVGTDGATARITRGNFENPLPSFVYCYWESGDPVYLRRAMELMADFCATNQPEFWRRWRDSVDGLDVPDEPALAEWRLNLNALEPGWRYKNFMQTLAGFAKSLGPDRPETWETILAPRTADVPRARLDLVDPAQLALIAISGYEHHAGRLLWFCVRPGAVPNQRSMGLKALAMLNLTFPDFRKAPQLAELLDMTYTEMLESNFLPDGGSLEQSFNYNIEDMRGLEEIAALYGPEAPPDFVETMLEKAAARRAVNDGLRTPLGGLPQVGNSHGILGKNVWESEEAADRYLASDAVRGREPVHPQEYLSRDYPYSGFYGMRDGWGLRDLYLFFINGRPQRGHSMRDNLSIQVTAYGRRMVVCGGPPTYGNPHNEDARGADFYLSEASSLKTNTIIVDGKSQARNAPPAVVAPQTPVESRWHTGPRFDFVDGHYALGYEAPDRDDRRLDMDVEHRRTVIFVREARLWIIMDRLTTRDEDERVYSQLWNFLPRIEDPAWENTVAGFSEEEVILEAPARQFRTADPEGPNVEFHHFGPRSLQYRKHCGDRERWLGWYARGIGDAVPAVDVHASWSSRDGGMLVTVLAPTDVGSPRAFSTTESRDDPERGVAGFTATLHDGSSLRVLAAERPAPLRIGEYSAQAEALLLCETPRGTAGIVCGGDRLDTPGGRTLTSESDHFEFSPDGTGAWQTVPIWMPRVPHIEPVPRPVLDMADHPPVTVESDMQDALVRYTTDGSEPDGQSPVYEAPIRLTQETTVKARYFREGVPLPLVAARTYRPFRYRLREPDATDTAGFVPGLRYAYAKRDRWSRLYDLWKEAEYRPLEAGEAASLDHRPRDRLQIGQAAMVFNGYLRLPEDGIYTFHVAARDGVDLFIWNPERDLELPPVALCTYLDGEGHGSAALKAGFHRFKVAYKKSHADDRMVVEVEGPGIARQSLPAEWLFRARQDAP